MNDITIDRPEIREDRWSAEIREINLSYLMLAQSMLRADRVQAMYRLGCSEEIAEILEGLTPAQIVRIAGGNTLMCRVRFDDELVWGLLADHARAAERPGEDASIARLHAGILTAGRFGEAV